jgi:hypothetical protein
MRRERYAALVQTLISELGLLALTAVSFWLLDRYVAGCEKI